MSSDSKGYLLICLFFVFVAFLPEMGITLVMIPIGIFLSLCFLGAIMYILEPLLMSIFDSDEPIFKGIYDWFDKLFK